MLTEEYAHILTSAIQTAAASQKEKILQAAGMVEKTLAADGLIYVFGCGHSHMLAEETFYRAGGLACVAPVFYEPLMLHEGAARSSRLEKETGLADTLLARYSFAPADILICVSTSGVNAVPVEFAAGAKARGIPVIGVSSDAYLEQQPHNRYNAHLQEVCDVCIDNGAPHGDACLQPDGLEVPMTPVSTVASVFVVNSVLAEAAALAARAGVAVPVYRSGNVPGGAEYNQALIQRYSPRIACL